MNQVLVYLFVNAGLLAMFACLWVLNREPKKTGATTGAQGHADAATVTTTGALNRPL